MEKYYKIRVLPGSAGGPIEDSLDKSSYVQTKHTRRLHQQLGWTAKALSLFYDIP